MNASFRPTSLAFTLVELLVAIAIAGLLLAVTVPMSMKFYESMQYRHAVRTLMSAFTYARQEAMQSGKIQDVLLDPATGTFQYGEGSRELPDSVTLVVHSAADLSRAGSGVIRFYPEGGSTGGDVDLEGRTGSGVRISVDWLMGGISQTTYEID